MKDLFQNLGGKNFRNGLETLKWSQVAFSGICCVDMIG